MRTLKLNMTHNLKNSSARRGFTLIEMLIVVSVTAVLATIGTVSYNGAVKRDQLDSYSKEIISSLEKARTKAINQEEGDYWGVRFEANTSSAFSNYAIFKGATSGTDFIDVKNLNTNVNFTSPNPSGVAPIEEIVFNKSIGTIKDGINHLIQISNGSLTKDIYINKNGLISLGLPSSVDVLPAPTLTSPSDGTIIGLVTSQNLAWGVVTGAQTYRLQVSTDINFGSLLFDDSTLTSTSYTITDLQAYTVYYWRVNAYSLLTGSSLWSSIRSFGTLTPPSAPVSPSGSPSNGINILAWSVPTTSGGSSITGYKIYWGTVSGNLSNTINPGNVLTYSHTGLTNGTTYYYKVAAINEFGEGTQTSEFSSTPQPPPTAGTLTITPSTVSYVPGTVTTMSAPFTSNVTITGCEYTLNGGTNWYASTLSGSIPNYTCTQSNITGFIDGSSYTFNMRATNSAGTTTATVVARTGDTVGPTVADNWTNNWTGTSPVTVTLTPNDVRSGVASTKYCVDTTNSCTPSTGTVGTSVSVTCAAGTVCTQYVRYASWDNVNNASAVYSETVRQDTLAPTQGGVLTITPGSGQNTLSWTTATDTGSGLFNYLCKYSTTSAPSNFCVDGIVVATMNAAATSYIQTGLTPGTTYYYRLCAQDNVSNIVTGITGQGVPTAATTTTTTTAPSLTCAQQGGICTAANRCVGTCSTDPGGCTGLTPCCCRTSITTTTCVLAGTKIDMADGSKRSIEDIEVGDMVLSYNEQTGQNEPGNISKIFHHKIEEMNDDYYMIINNSLKITPNHKVMINGSWNMVGNLKLGDKLQLNDGNTLIVLSIQKVEQKVPTYNLKVETLHNYYANNILIHNDKAY